MLWNTTSQTRSRKKELRVDEDEIQIVIEYLSDEKKKADEIESLRSKERDHCNKDKHSTQKGREGRRSNCEMILIT